MSLLTTVEIVIFIILFLYLSIKNRKNGQGKND